MVYEKLEKFCKICKRLDHEYLDCPQNPNPGVNDEEMQGEHKAQMKDQPTYRKDKHLSYDKAPRNEENRQNSNPTRDAKNSNDAHVCLY